MSKQVRVYRNHRGDAVLTRSWGVYRAELYWAQHVKDAVMQPQVTVKYVLRRSKAFELHAQNCFRLEQPFHVNCRCVVGSVDGVMFHNDQPKTDPDAWNVDKAGL